MASHMKGKRLTMGEKLAMIDSVLDQELTNHKQQGWNKLDKTMKSGLLNRFVQESLASTYQLTSTEVQQGQKVLQDALDRQQLTLVKEVVYDKNTRQIQRVPNLRFDATTRLFSF